MLESICDAIDPGLELAGDGEVVHRRADYHDVGGEELFQHFFTHRDFMLQRGICEACKRRSDINPKNVLIAAALIVYIGVNVAAYIKDHPPRELTAEQREKIAEGQRLATRAAMMAGYVD